ncbi:hypothetical protein C0J52_25270, partial [Blattella germanica]
EWGFINLVPISPLIHELVPDAHFNTHELVPNDCMNWPLVCTGINIFLLHSHSSNELNSTISLVFSCEKHSITFYFFHLLLRNTFILATSTSLCSIRETSWNLNL